LALAITPAGNAYHALKDTGALQPEAIAKAALWLVSEHARYLTASRFQSTPDTCSYRAGNTTHAGC
jgi:hypothetical protein